MPIDQCCEGVAELLGQSGGPLDVGEDERHPAGRERARGSHRHAMVRPRLSAGQDLADRPDATVRGWPPVGMPGA